MLELILKKKWFVMIESGVKLEEYREIKPYWWKRIIAEDWPLFEVLSFAPLSIPHGWKESKHKQVRFRLGYAKDAPEMILKIMGVRIGNARAEWAEGEMGEMIIVRLGERIK